MRPGISMQNQKPSIQVTGMVMAIDEYWDSGLFWDNGGFWDEGVHVGLPSISLGNQKPSIQVT